MLGRMHPLCLLVVLIVGCLSVAIPASAVVSQPSIEYGNSKDKLPLEIEDSISKLDCACVITIGSQALKAALEQKEDPRPIFSIGISTALFMELSSQYPDRRMTVIYSDPDPKLLLLLSEHFFGKSRTAMFYSGRTSFLEKSALNVKLFKAKAGEISRPLSRLDNVKALIIFPDSNIWNRDSFTATVRSLYRQNKVAIGFSESLVKAGAFAAVYAKNDFIYQQLLSDVSKFSRNNILPEPQYAKEVDIAINNKIARSLNIPIDDKDDVLDAILTRYSR